MQQRELWERVNELWQLVVDGDPQSIGAALHPRYIGWEAGQPLPHDRDFAIRSVSAAPVRMIDYRLTPLSVEVYDGTVGVAHYTYAAQVSAGGGSPRQVTGRWSEVYLKQGGEWLMISVQGGPDEVGL